MPPKKKYNKDGSRKKKPGPKKGQKGRGWIGEQIGSWAGGKLGDLAGDYIGGLVGFGQKGGMRMGPQLGVVPVPLGTPMFYDPSGGRRMKR